MHDYGSHGTPEFPGPPRARQVVGLAVIVLGGLLVLGVAPLDRTSVGIVLLLIGVGLVV